MRDVGVPGGPIIYDPLSGSFQARRREVSVQVMAITIGGARPALAVHSK